MDVGCHEDHPTLCSGCVFVVRALIRMGTVQPDNEVQRWWAENDLMMWKRPEAQRYDGLEEARNYVP